MRALLLLSVLFALPVRAQLPLFELASPQAQAEDRFGAAVSSVPDVDGDGVTDLLLSAFGIWSSPHRAELYSGANGVLLHMLTDWFQTDSFVFATTSVVGLDDVDGDGYGDVAIGSPDYTDLELYEGKVFVYSGATGTLLLTLMKPNGVGKRFGNALARLPGGNGAELNLIVGAPGDGGGGPGKVFVYRGDTSPLILRSPSAISGGHFGEAVAAVPDVDGDGTADVFAGAPGEGSLKFEGRTHLFGGAAGDTLLTLASPHPVQDGYFGTAVAGLQDLDGDGRGDLLVGAPGELTGTGVRAGRAYVFSGTTGTLLYELTSPNEQEAGFFGYAVAEMGDTDGDDVADLLVGASGTIFANWPPQPGGEGRAYVFSGATGALLETLEPDGGPDPLSFGHAVAGFSDLDGDGRGDALVGSPYAALGQGRAYLSVDLSHATTLAVNAAPLLTPAARGDTLHIATTLTNPTAEPVAFDLRFLGVHDDVPFTFDGAIATALTLAPGETLSYEGTVPIPLALARGAYTGRVTAARVTGGTLGVGTFPFEVFSGPAVEVEAAALNSPVAGGDTLRATATVSNPGPHPAPVTLRLYVFPPGTPPLSSPMGTVALGPGESATREGALVLPPDALPGVWPAKVQAHHPDDTLAGTETFWFEVVTGTPTEDEAPTAFTLHPPRPNPAPGSVLLGFDLPAPAPVRVAVYDVLGREVAVLADGPRPAGLHEVALAAGLLAPGAYVVRLTAGATTASRPLTIMR